MCRWWWVRSVEDCEGFASELAELDELCVPSQVRPLVLVLDHL
jgi:hypothetical protein